MLNGNKLLAAKAPASFGAVRSYRAKLLVVSFVIARRLELCMWHVSTFVLGYVLAVGTVEGAWVLQMMRSCLEVHCHHSLRVQPAGYLIGLGL